MPQARKPVPPALSTASLLLFQELLSQLQLQVSHPEFAEKAIVVMHAKSELAAALEATAKADALG